MIHGLSGVATDVGTIHKKRTPHWRALDPQILRRVCFALSAIGLIACNTDRMRTPTDTGAQPTTKVVRYLPRLQETGVARSAGSSPLATSVRGGLGGSALVTDEFTVGIGGIVVEGLQPLKVTCEDDPTQPMCGTTSFTPIPPADATGLGSTINSLFASDAESRAAIVSFLQSVPKQALRAPGVFSQSMNLLDAQEMSVDSSKFRVAVFVDRLGRKIRTTMTQILPTGPVPLAHMSYSWNASDRLQAIGFYVYNRDGSPAAGFEASTESNAPLQFSSKEATPADLFATACSATRRFAERVLLPTVAGAQVGQDCWYEKSKLIAIGVGAGLGVYALPEGIPSALAACSTSGKTLAACTSGFLLVTVGIANQWDEYTRCVEAQNALTSQWTTYYNSPVGRDQLNQLLGLGMGGIYEYHFYSSFNTPTYLIGLMRGESTESGPIGTVTGGFVRNIGEPGSLGGGGGGGIPPWLQKLVNSAKSK